MVDFTRGTTPLLEFGIPFDGEDCEVIIITFSQSGEIVLEKEKSDITVEGSGLSFRLSQEETLRFRDDSKVEIQVAVRMTNGRVYRSEVIRTTARRILHNAEI